MCLSVFGGGGGGVCGGGCFRGVCVCGWVDGCMCGCVGMFV